MFGAQKIMKIAFILPDGTRSASILIPMRLPIGIDQRHTLYETLLPLPGEAVYELRSVVIHDGPAGSGHYFCYVRGWDNFWYLCNDRQAPVRQARVESVLNQRPYMLVYEKR